MLCAILLKAFPKELTFVKYLSVFIKLSSLIIIWNWRNNCENHQTKRQGRCLRPCEDHRSCWESKYHCHWSGAAFLGNHCQNCQWHWNTMCRHEPCSGRWNHSGLGGNWDHEVRCIHRCKKLYHLPLWTGAAAAVQHNWPKDSKSAEFRKWRSQAGKFQ